MKKMLAFTLAETLIVIGIIGIVSALTLPNLNSSTGDQEKVAKVKKIHQNLNDALGRAVAVYGPVDEWFVNDSNTTAQNTRFFERLTEFMKLSKSNVSNYTAVLADGISISSYIGTDSADITFYLKGPNKSRNWGSDIFVFETDFDIADFKPKSEGTTTQGASTLYGGMYGSPGGCNYGCAKWVVEFGNLDYLKLDSSGKCPNGNSLNVLANPPVVSCK